VVGVDVPTSEACDRGSECLYDLEFQLGSILFAKAILFKLISVATVKLSREGRRFYNRYILPCANRLLRRQAGAKPPTHAELRRWLSNGSSEFDAWTATSATDAPVSESFSPDPGSVSSSPEAGAADKLAKRGSAQDESDCVSVAEQDFVRHPASNVVDEYKEVVIMYGYMVLFASAFPLAPFLCLISLGLELRADAYKFCEARRPLPRAARHHPLWFDCMHMLTSAAIMTNIGLVLFTVPNALPEVSLSAKIGGLLFIEHAVLLARWSLQVLVPDKPIEVLRGLLESKLAFKRLHEVLSRAYNSGRGGGGGLSNFELMQLGLHSILARDLKHGRDKQARGIKAAGSGTRRLKDDYFGDPPAIPNPAAPPAEEADNSGPASALWRLGWLSASRVEGDRGTKPGRAME